MTSLEPGEGYKPSPDEETIMTSLQSDGHTFLSSPKGLIPPTSLHYIHLYHLFSRDFIYQLRPASSIQTKIKKSYKAIVSDLLLCSCAFPALKDINLAAADMTIGNR